jgi:hypothetical protein
MMNRLMYQQRYLASSVESRRLFLTASATASKLYDGMSHMFECTRLVHPPVAITNISLLVISIHIAWPEYWRYS